MRRSALILLTLHLAAGPALAQAPMEPPPLAPLPGIGFEVLKPLITVPKPVFDPRTATAPLKEQLINFDPQRAEVVGLQNHWQLVAEGHVLKDFGRTQVEPNQAQRLVRSLHLTQH